MNSLGDFGGRLAVGVGGHGIERRNAGALRVGVVHVCRASPAPRSTMTKRCSFTGSTKTCTPGIFTSRSLIAPAVRFLRVGMRPARRSVMLPLASTVQKLARIATSPSCKLEADAGRLQRAAADQVLQRIVAEQAEMPRTAAGADAGQHGNAAAADAALGERVEIRRVGRFELRQTAGLLAAGRPGRRPRT